MVTVSGVVVTASPADLAAPPWVPEIVAAEEVQLELVETMKFALVAPAPTFTLPGTAATEVSLLESATTAPPAGAAALRVTVPVETVPPVTLVGSRLKEERVAEGSVTWR